MEENDIIIKFEAQLDKIETERFEYKQDLEREKPLVGASTSLLTT